MTLDDTDDKVGWWLNYYECPECDYHWYDVWDCQVDMRCERCNCRNISPKNSYELTDGGIDKAQKCIWKVAGHSVFGKVYETSCAGELDEPDIHPDAIYCPFCGEEFQYEGET